MPARRSLATIVGVLATTAFGSRSLEAQQPQQPAPRMAASSFATVEVHVNARSAGGQWYLQDAGLVGPARIAISYGQPHARGRQVEGGLIPKDTVWRFGADEATTLHTDVDLILGDSAHGGLRLPRGDYTLFILYGTDGYQLIVNRQTGQWGTDYDATQDVGRIALTRTTLVEPEESLSVYLIPDAARPTTGYAELRGTLRIKWGRVDLRTPWSVVR